MLELVLNKLSFILELVLNKLSFICLKSAPFLNWTRELTNLCRSFKHVSIVPEDEGVGSILKLSRRDCNLMKIKIKSVFPTLIRYFKRTPPIFCHLFQINRHLLSHSIVVLCSEIPIN